MSNRESTSDGSERSPGLDLVRAVAIVWVTIYHAMTLGFIPDANRWTVGFGWMGVDLFFVLSGYLIAGQLLRSRAAGRKTDHVRFYRRRLLRTLPAYTVIVAIYFLMPAFRERIDIQPLWQFATFTANLLIDLRTPKTFSHVWSLCVEEQFYLVFPGLVAWLAIRASSRKTCAVIVGVLLSGMAVRGLLWWSMVAETPFDADAEPGWRAYMTLIYYPTWSRLDGLLAGVVAATVQTFRPGQWRRLTAHPDLLLSIGLTGMTSSILFFDDQIAALTPAVLGFPLLALSIGLIVAAASRPDCIIGRWRVPGAGWLASGAYSLYLSQKIAFHLVSINAIPAPGTSVAARLLTAMLAVGALGAVLYWTVERPFLRWRDRLDAQRPERSRARG